MIIHSSAGTWHGMGDERKLYDSLFPKNKDGDRILLDSIQEISDSSHFPNKITLNIQSKDKETSINDISKIQFALNLINHYEQKDIELAMRMYINLHLPEKLI